VDADGVVLYRVRRLDTDRGARSKFVMVHPSVDEASTKAELPPTCSTPLALASFQSLARPTPTNDAAAAIANGRVFTDLVRNVNLHAKGPPVETWAPSARVGACGHPQVRRRGRQLVGVPRHGGEGGREVVESFRHACQSPHCGTLSLLLRTARPIGVMSPIALRHVRRAE
jgi:hypothetical protein